MFVRRLGTSQGDGDDACLANTLVLCVRMRVAPLCVATLQGLTAVVKDCFAVAGTHCSNGSPAWLATHPAAEQHAAAVQVRQTGRPRARYVKNSAAAQLALPCCCSLGCPLTAVPVLVHLERLLQALLDAGVTIVGKNVMDEMVSWQAAWM